MRQRKAYTPMSAIIQASVFQHPEGRDLDERLAGDRQDRYEPGWYYWFAAASYLPESDPVGPFSTELIAARRAAEEWSERHAATCETWPPPASPSPLSAMSAIQSVEAHAAGCGP